LDSASPIAAANETEWLLFSEVTEAAFFNRPLQLELLLLLLLILSLILFARLILEFLPALLSIWL
jgi:hypothetical protein